MKKRGKRIKHTAAFVPTMIALKIRPEVHAQEQMALVAMRDGWATTGHFNAILDAQHMLNFAAEMKADPEAKGMAQFLDIAMANIRDRYLEEKTIRAEPEEVDAVRAFFDYAQDWWGRQSGRLFHDAYLAMEALRERQRADAAPVEADNG